VNALHQVLRTKSHFHPAAVHRAGDVVVRDAGPWAPTVHALLRHLKEVGFASAPRLVGSGFDAEGRETLSYVDGEFVHPGPWTLEGAASVGVLLRQLHAAPVSFRAPPDAVWYPWFGRALGGVERVFGHCDLAPSNIVASDGRAVALIDCPGLAGACRCLAAPPSHDSGTCARLNPEETLVGGNMAAGVHRVGQTVRRPTGPWTPTLHRLFHHLERGRLSGCTPCAQHGRARS
jgi:hypothetical protein